MSQKIANAATARTSQAISPEEAAAGARAIVRLFSDWQLADADARQILGGISASTWARWKNGNVGRVNQDLATRISLLLGIHKGLRYLFIDNMQGYAWVKKPNLTFEGQSALDVMRQGSIFSLQRVRRYLDGEHGGA
ncbi:MAG TPA: MbcA/ParS/Xre antitoxin family protein [Pseudorhizobium sp.]|nr:MbcA/ParS/Xre antitoxin family protein [Pseudorhizobium sp.]